MDFISEVERNKIGTVISLENEIPAGLLLAVRFGVRTFKIFNYNENITRTLE